ncbi:hypothetical protein E2C01_032443 [Portunus trituberculatus]|uniref:Uncharacterized protein n=1 Tax=Portunus trituberculatus TaxID=210409 RepID=A0A5B7EZM5_PORTR|nr:hypothetical protein [Portunus trituberculatus]
MLEERLSNGDEDWAGSARRRELVVQVRRTGTPVQERVVDAGKRRSCCLAEGVQRRDVALLVAELRVGHRR